MSTDLITSVAKSPIKSILHQFSTGSSGSYSLNEDTDNTAAVSQQQRRNACTPQEDNKGISLLHVSPMAAAGKVDNGWCKKMREFAKAQQRTTPKQQQGLLCFVFGSCFGGLRRFV